MRTAHAVAARALVLGALLLVALLILPVGLAQVPDGGGTTNLTDPTGSSSGSDGSQGSTPDGGGSDATVTDPGSGDGFGDVVGGLDLGDGLLLGLGVTVGALVAGLLFVGGTKFMGRGAGQGDLRTSLLQRLRADPGQELPLLANELGTDLKTLRGTLEQLREEGLVEPRDLGGRTVYHPAIASGNRSGPAFAAGNLVAADVEEDLHRPGTTVLLRGDPGSGAGFLARDLAAASGHVLVLTTTDPAPVVENELLERDASATPRVVDLAAEHLTHLRNGGSDGPGRPPGGDDPDYLHAAFQHLQDTRADRTLLEGLDFLLELYPPGDVVRGVRALSLANRETGGVLLLTKSPGTADDATEHLLEQIADVVLDVRAQHRSTGAERALHVRKVRHAPDRVRTIPYRFGDDGALVRDARDRIRGG